MPLNFKQRNIVMGRRVVIIALIAASIALLSFFLREPLGGMLHKAQSVVSTSSTAAQQSSVALGSTIDYLSTSLKDLTASGESLSSLREQNEQLRAMLVQAEEYRQEVNRLQALLSIKDTYTNEGIGARVIGRSYTAWSQTITIDKGSEEGISTSLTVMGATGVVGQTIEVGPHSSVVRLITDPQSGVAVKLQSNRGEGIVAGSLEGLLYLEDTSQNTVVEVGDVAITSGLGGSYTPGLIVGTIVRIDSTQGSESSRAVVSPNGSISSLEEVYVVLSSQSQTEASE